MDGAALASIMPQPAAAQQKVELGIHIEPESRRSRAVHPHHVGAVGGVVGMIGPWNFPLHLSSRSVAPAIATGADTLLTLDAPAVSIKAVRIAPTSVSIDIGGTFTDFVVHDQEAGRSFTGKVLSTPRNPAEGVITGLKELLVQVQEGDYAAEVTAVLAFIRA